MKRRGLVPLSAASRAGREAAEAWAAERLQGAWTLVVGPLLARHTRVLRVTRGTLLVGCWHNAHIPHLRASAEATWPDIQARIRRSFGLDLHRIEITPCDPPPPPPPPKPDVEDPLDDLLRLLRTRGNPDWTNPSS